LETYPQIFKPEIQFVYLQYEYGAVSPMLAGDLLFHGKNSDKERICSAVNFILVPPDL